MVFIWFVIENRSCGRGCIFCFFNFDYNIIYYKGYELVFVKVIVFYYKYKVFIGVLFEFFLLGVLLNFYNYNIYIL